MTHKETTPARPIEDISSSCKIKEWKDNVYVGYMVIDMVMRHTWTYFEHTNIYHKQL